MTDCELIEQYLTDTGWKRTQFGYYDNNQGVRISLKDILHAIRVLAEVEQIQPTLLKIKLNLCESR